MVKLADLPEYIAVALLIWAGLRCCLRPVETYSLTWSKISLPDDRLSIDPSLLLIRALEPK